MQRQSSTDELTASVDRQRLRASLRLCFAPEFADALAGRANERANSRRETLLPVIRTARLSYGSERLLSPLRRRGRSGDTTPLLAPRLGLPGISALALALHLGLGLEIESLVSLFGRPAREISLALHQARRAIDPTEPQPCPDMVEAIGRYRDPANGDVAERLAFLQHVATCSRCRPALAAARAVDMRLLAVIDAHLRALPSMPQSEHRHRTLWITHSLLWGGIALLLAALVVGVTLSGGQLFRSEAPVPLLDAKAAGPSFSGWLLQTSDTGALSAVDLAGGAHRLLIPGNRDSTAQIKLAPDQRQIAQLVTTSPANATIALRVYALDGTLLREWPHLERSGRYRLLGWLNPRTILVSSAPGGALQDLAHATILAFDPETGTQRPLLDGWASSALASPDGKYLAIDFALSDGTSVLQVRSIAGADIGALVTTYPSGGTPFAWTTDSRLIFWTPTDSGSTIDSLTLDGTVQTLYRSGIGFVPIMLGLSPDGTRLIYTNTLNPGTGPWSYWQMTLATGAARKLADAGTGYGPPPSHVIWSPDGATLVLTLNEPFYLPHPAQTGSATSIASYRVAAFGADGDARGTLLDQFTNQSLLAWLPEDALPTQAEPGDTVSGHHAAFTSGGLPQLGGPRPQLTSDSTLSPDGSTALVYGPAYNFAMALAPDGSNAQSAGLPNDPSWLPDGSGTISVQQHASGAGTISRIAVYGDIGAPARSVTDYDPAQLGDRPTAAYRSPMLAPDGLHYSFFVVDRQAVTLWIGGYQEAPHSIAGWQIPNGAGIESPLIARWLNNTMLIYTEPVDWQNGLPRRVTLHRVTLNDDAAIDDTLTGWQPHGTERGIVLRELRISANGATLALRLRHLTGNDPNNDVFDSIAAIDTSNLNQGVELARGAPGNGLSWSPDGTQLVAVIKQKLTVFSIRGGDIQQIATDSRDVSYPLWVLPNEIWYESGSGTRSQMIRATR